jgi:soluble lytic murein transglycosylase-like protein
MRVLQRTARRSALLLAASALLMRPIPVGPANAVSPVPIKQETSSPMATLYEAVSHCRPSLTEAERWRIAAAINDEGSRYGYDPLFVLAIAEVESTCSPTALGVGGSIGLIQVMPSTARALAHEVGLRWRGAEMLKVPAHNVRLGLRYLWKLERQFRNPYLAMVAYNMGPARAIGMPRERARSSRYVRKILDRYERILKRHAARA